jgi:ABC-type amino acid transport system permease subunit
MKTTGINELRTLVGQAVPDAAAAQKLTEAIVRATELAEEESKPVTRDHLDKRLSELESSLKGWVFTIALAINGLFAGVIIGAVYAMIQTLKHP